METKVQNIQDVYLNNVRRDKTPVTIFLVSGVKLMGRLKGFDKYSVILDSNHQEQLIFKHAISTVTTSRSGPGPASRRDAPREEKNPERTEE
jgi:host factor-I protein